MKKIILSTLAVLAMSISTFAEESSNILKLEKECNNKNPKACVALGDRYVKDKSIDSKFDKVKKYFEKACTLNNSEGCFKLAGIFMIKKDYVQFMKYSKKSCNLNNAKGCTLLGFSYELHGNYLEAIKSYKKACQSGSDMGCKQEVLLNKSLEKLKKTSVCSKSHYDAYLVGYKEMKGKKHNQKNLEIMINRCDEINKDKTFKHTFSCKLGGSLALGKQNKLSCENFTQKLEETLEIYENQK